MEGAVGAFGRRRVIWQPNELISRTNDEELFFLLPPFFRGNFQFIGELLRYNEKDRREKETRKDFLAVQILVSVDRFL